MCATQSIALSLSLSIPHFDEEEKGDPTGEVIIVQHILHWM